MNKTIKNSVITLFATALLSSTTVADDTDIINIDVPQKSNVLFVMDMSGSMSYRLSSNDAPAASEKSRKEVLHEALKTVLNAPELATLNINVGLASFAGNGALSLENQRGHGISYPVTSLLADAAPRLDSNPLWDHKSSIYDGETVTSYLPLAGLRTSIGYMGDSIPAGWAPKGKTPIVDALYEAALYFRGAPVNYGKHDPSRRNSAHPSTYTGLIYDKTVTTIVPTLQACDGLGTTNPVGTVCNATEACTTNIHTKTCSSGDLACEVNYICGLPTTEPSTLSNCDLAACTASAGSSNPNKCDLTNFTTITTTPVCNLATASACEAQPNYVANSCVARTVPSVTTPGACILDIEGSCTGSYLPDVIVPAYTVFDCTMIEDIYHCPSNPSPTSQCTRDITTCKHTVDVPQTLRVPQGTATYNSPIVEECANNSIILLSDGKPTKNTSANKVASLVGSANANGCNTAGTPQTIAHDGRCGKELTKYLANTDNNTTLAGDQFITTHTIGLSLGASPDSLAAKAYLEELALNGGGQFINASTPEGLVAALLTTITSNAKARSFTSPTYTSSATSMANGDSVYVPVFDKSLGPVWSGNLKKYTRSGGRLVDADGLDATDPLGSLKTTARDLWSAVPSVHFVTSGGVANKLPNPDARVLYTDAGMTGGVVFTTANELNSSNTAITKAILGDATMTNAYKDELIKFIRGKKPDGTPRKHIGDIIHSKPVYVEYASTKRLYIGTNEGYLHSFDEATGVEQFAFMPSTLLKNIDIQFKNDALSEHPYGVDGPIGLHHEDNNNDGIVNGADTAVLYFGLRRGGKAYYALDVTNPSAPKLKWKIDNETSGFSKLGYSWSQPVIANMKHNGGTTPAEQVVVFSGGYVDDNGLEDENNDGIPDHPGGEPDNSGTGADVFIVKASDGSLVWSLSDSTKTLLTNANFSVEYAVPGNIRVMDISGNSALDRLYFGDTGGNVWRVDFESNLTGAGAKKAKLKLFADLGGVTPKRKFFTEPDVALFKSQGRYRISVAIGSGQRPNPLDTTTDDHFFLIFDKDIRNSPALATPTITKAVLKDATNGSVTGVLSGGHKGWYMDLKELNGEKVLSRATTYNNKVFFNTFGSTSISAALCGSSNVNQSRLYAVDLITAGAVIDLNSDSVVDPNNPDDRSTTITTSGDIPSAPHIIMDNPSTCVQGDCAIKDSVGSGRGLDIPLSESKILRKVFWFDKE